MMDDTTHFVSSPAAIAHIRRFALLQALKLEIYGLSRGRPPSAYSIIKREFGLKGNRQRVCEQFIDLLEAQRPPREGENA